MVIGQYSSNVGAGNRVTFPRKFSHEIGRELLITKGLDQNLIMVAFSEKQVLFEAIETKPYVRTAVREMQAFVLGNTFEVVLDQVNRFVIPTELFVYAGIGKEVVFIGVQEFIQVWDRRRWNAYQKRIQQHIGRNVVKLPGNE